jgi:glycosyltransferase involved in cell wall biosynthesis
MKIVWLCHLNNEFISNKLGVKNSIEFAPWIFRLAEIFDKFNDVDIHIVSPYAGILHERTFMRGNLHFHFFPFMFPIMPKRVIHFFHNYSDFILIKKSVRRIINGIDPDLIHMFGTENAYFTSSIFQFKNNYPVFITIQGFANHLITNNYLIRKRKEVEIEIIKEFNIFGIRDEAMKSYLRKINPECRFIYHEISPYIPKYQVKDGTVKIFDIIFFASISKDKGIEDLIKAVSIIVKEKKDLKVCVVGPAPPQYIYYLKELAKDLAVNKNIVFFGPLQTIDDVHQLVIKSVVTVLPTYADTIPGTIIESMFMGIPCVSYAVGGIPSLNKNNEIIKLVDKGDILSLAKEILLLLGVKKVYNDIAIGALEYVKSRWQDDIIYKSVLSAYKEILT